MKKQKLEKLNIDLGITQTIHSVMNNEIQNLISENYQLSRLHFGIEQKTYRAFGAKRSHLTFQNNFAGIVSKNNNDNKRVEKLSTELHNAIVPIIQKYVDENNEQIATLFKNLKDDIFKE